MKRAGFTLVETVISMFLLLGAFIIMYAVIDGCIRNALRTQQLSMASTVAQQTTAQLRSWAWQTSAGIYNYDTGWSIYSNDVFAAPQNPQFTVHIHARADRTSLLSPDSALEIPYAPPVSTERVLATAVVPVDVSVSWDASDPSQQMSLTTYVGEPPRAPATSISILPVVAVDPMPRNAFISFTAQLTNATSGAAALGDTTFTWSIVPPPAGNPVGMGTLLPPPPPAIAGVTTQSTRDGRTITFENVYYGASGQPIYTGGSCMLQAQAVVGGVTLTGTSVVLPLSP